LGKTSVFYFDDEESQLRLFESVFGDEFDVRTADDLAEARRMLRECSADIIISDQSMPDIKGTMFLREAAAICPDSYRILLTGTTTVMDVVTEVSVRIVHLYMPKPWRAERMREILRRVASGA
jgi:DNA-binding NtrC family response regulator